MVIRKTAFWDVQRRSGHTAGIVNLLLSQAQSTLCHSNLKMALTGHMYVSVDCFGRSKSRAATGATSWVCLRFAHGLCCAGLHRHLPSPVAALHNTARYASLHEVTLLITIISDFKACFCLPRPPHTLTSCKCSLTGSNCSAHDVLLVISGYKVYLEHNNINVCIQVRTRA